MSARQRAKDKVRSQFSDITTAVAASEETSDVWEPIVTEAKEIIGSLLHYPPTALTPRQQMVFQSKVDKAFAFLREHA